MPFETHPSPKKGEDGKPLLYIRPKSGQKLDFKSFENYCTGNSDIKPGEMERVFAAFMKGANYWLSKGYSIESPIGVFRPKIGLKRQVTDPDDISNNDVEFLDIDFQPTKEFMDQVAYNIEEEGFRYVRKTASSILLKNEDKLLKALKASIDANNGFTTVASFMEHSGLSRYSAVKALNKWSAGDAPLLQKTRYGQSYIYTEI